MTQAVTQSGLTFEEYLLLPDDGQRTEFVNGALLKVTGPSPLQIELVKALAKVLDTYLSEVHIGTELRCFSGPGIQIPQPEAPDNARDPDLVVCTTEQWGLVKRQTKALFLKGNAPLLAIEVVSPGSIQKDTEELVSEYALAGVAEYWIINPLTATVTVYVLAGQHYRLKGAYQDAQTVESKLLTHWHMTATDMLAEA